MGQNMFQTVGWQDYLLLKTGLNSVCLFVSFFSSTVPIKFTKIC